MRGKMSEKNKSVILVEIYNAIMRVVKKHDLPPCHLVHLLLQNIEINFNALYDVSTAFQERIEELEEQIKKGGKVG